MSRRTARSSGGSTVQTLLYPSSLPNAGEDLPSGVSSSHSSSHDSSAHPRIRAVQAAVRKSKKATAEALKHVSPDATVEELRAATPSPPPLPSAVAPASAATTRRTRSSSRQPSSASTAKAAWRPILYEIQPYEDNYVDESFLSSLITNANVRPLSYWQLCLSTCALTQRLCLLVLFLLVFFCMFHSLVPIEHVLLLDAASLIGGVVTVLAIQYAMTERKNEWIADSLPVLPRILLLTAFLLFLSPLLNTLTVSYSSDTIWALTGVLSGVHLLCFDYRWINEAAVGERASPPSSASPALHTRALSPTPGGSSPAAVAALPLKPREFEGILSLNAGVFASVLLGSRLEADPGVGLAENSLRQTEVGFLASAYVHCFAFVLWSFLIFGGFTVLSCWIRRWSLRLHVLVTLLLVAICSWCLAILPLPVILLPIFLLACFAVNLIAPAALIWSQKYKNALQGPWDYDDANEMESDNL